MLRHVRGIGGDNIRKAEKSGNLRGRVARLKDYTTLIGDRGLVPGMSFGIRTIDINHEFSLVLIFHCEVSRNHPPCRLFAVLRINS
jgi:hypothetical protein